MLLTAPPVILGLAPGIQSLNNTYNSHTPFRLTAPRAVILAEASRTAEGGTTGFGGNPEERRQPPVGHLHNKMVRRSGCKPEQAGDGLDDRGKLENNTLFYWIPEQARE